MQLVKRAGGRSIVGFIPRPCLFLMRVVVFHPYRCLFFIRCGVLLSHCIFPMFTSSNEPIIPIIHIADSAQTEYCPTFHFP